MCDSRVCCLCDGDSHLWNEWPNAPNVPNAPNAIPSTALAGSSPMLLSAGPRGGVSLIFDNTHSHQWCWLDLYELIAVQSFRGKSLLELCDYSLSFNEPPN